MSRSKNFAHFSGLSNSTSRECDVRRALSAPLDIFGSAVVAGAAQSALGGTPSSLWRSNSTPATSENASWRPHAHFHRWKFGIAVKRFPRTGFAPSAQGHAQVPYFYKVITHTVHHPLLARPSAETGFTHELRCTLYCFTHIADRCPPG